MKQINQLTEAEAKEILKFVYPNKDYDYMGLQFTPVIDKNGSMQVTFNIEPIVGILYHNGQDRCVLHFYNSKVVLWLYRNQYDIEKLLIHNQYFSQMEQNFDNMAFVISMLSKGDNPYESGDKEHFTIDYVKSRCKEIIEKYWYSDYD